MSQVENIQEVRNDRGTGDGANLSLQAQNYFSDYSSAASCGKGGCDLPNLSIGGDASKCPGKIPNQDGGPKEPFDGGKGDKPNDGESDSQDHEGKFDPDKKAMQDKEEMGEKDGKFDPDKKAMLDKEGLGEKGGKFDPDKKAMLDKEGLGEKDGKFDADKKALMGKKLQFKTYKAW